jgi:hypothetical protein
MSLDLWMQSKDCPTCGRHDCTGDSLNYTYNAAVMWREIFPYDGQMINIDGMTGEESLEKLKYGLGILKANPDKFLPLEPENKWGSYNGFMLYIKDLIDLAEKHPDWIWMSDR